MQLQMKISMLFSVLQNLQNYRMKLDFLKFVQGTRDNIQWIKDFSLNKEFEGVVRLVSQGCHLV
jgi:hypothetical protein